MRIRDAELCVKQICRSSCAACLCLLWLLSPLVLLAGDKTDLLDKVRAEHSAAWAAIHSLFCEMSITDDRKKGSVCQKTKYWQKGKIIRCLEESDLAKKDTFIDGPVAWELDTPLGKSATRKEPSGRIGGGNHIPVPGIGIVRSLRVSCDPWLYALFRFDTGAWKRAPLSFQELLAEPHAKHPNPSLMPKLELHSVSKREDLIHVHLSTTGTFPTDKGAVEDRRDLEFWFDPRLNYLVRKHLVRRSSNAITETEAARFIEHQPGIFFPESVKTEHRYKGKLSSKQTASFSNVRINEPIPQDVFQFRFPPGVLVTDYVNRKYAKTDDNGELTLPPIDSQGRLQRFPGFTTVGVPAEPFPQASRTDPYAWIWWFLPVVAGLLVVASVVAELWRSYARRRPILDAPTMLNLGNQERGVTIEAPFILANKGERKLLLDSFASSGDSQVMQKHEDGKVALVDSVEIAAEEKTELVVRLAVQGKVGAEIRQSISFRTNDPKRRQVILPVLVPRVEGGITAIPNRVDFGTVIVGTPVRQFIEVRDEAPSPRTVTRVSTGNGAHFHARFLPCEPPIADDRAGQLDVLLGHVELTCRAGEPGQLSGQLEILLDENRPPDLVSFGARVAPLVEPVAQFSEYPS